MRTEAFVDTSGFYALLVKKDDCHVRACAILRTAAERRTGFVTTDYVLDESATLLRARGHGHLVDQVFEIVLSSKACRLAWMDPERFEQTRKFFTKHGDHDWSFTDCFSFQVMKEFRLSKALTKDAHFKEAGYDPLLA